MTPTVSPDADTLDTATPAPAAAASDAYGVVDQPRPGRRVPYVLHEPPRFTRAPWRCRHGWHAWSIAGAAAVRQVAPGRWLCSLSRRCRRCPAIRHEQHRALPRALRSLRRPAP